MEIINGNTLSHIALSDIIFAPINKTFYTVTAISMVDCELTPTQYDGSFGSPQVATLISLIGYVLIKVTNY